MLMSGCVNDVFSVNINVLCLAKENVLARANVS